MSLHEADRLYEEELKTLQTDEAQEADDLGQYKDADEQKMQRLIQFLDENGVLYPSLEIRIVNGLRGVYATEKILEGEVVLHVPRRAMVTTEVAKASNVGRRIQASRRWLSPYGYLAAFLLETKREGGFWKPYFDVVPSKFPGMPLFYDQKHLEMLKGTHIWQQFIDAKALMFDDYKVVKDFLPGLTLHEFALARMAVTTRVYKLMIDGYETLGMVPLADMLNHTSPSPTHWTGRATHGFTIMALTDLQAGGEILESYGKRSNGRWLMSHGLCMEVNPDNLVEFDLPEIRKKHPFFNATRKLGWVSRKQRHFLVTNDYDSDDVRHMFSYLRLANCTDIERTRKAVVELGRVDPEEDDSAKASKKNRQKKAKDQSKVHPISVRNEIAALRMLVAATERAFERYTTTLEQDEQALKDPDLAWTMRFATMAAVSEKRLLKFYLDMARTAIGVLESSPFRLARAVGEQVRKGKPYEKYFRHLQEHLDVFSPFWHVSRLPTKKHRPAVHRKQEHGRKTTHGAFA
ncbi:SET domain-containing histone-lysine N-methyltransferase [Noviherbaspirillum denitrificans]|nr:SET domain-containing histone-lysine N-methyltransferase [Noviherbaspirillum denitrificans]